MVYHRVRVGVRGELSAGYSHFPRLCWWEPARWAGRRSSAAGRCSRCMETPAWTLWWTDGNRKCDYSVTQQDPSVTSLISILQSALSDPEGLWRWPADMTLSRFGWHNKYVLPDETVATPWLPRRHWKQKVWCFWWESGIQTLINRKDSEVIRLLNTRLRLWEKTPLIEPWT